MKPLHTQYYNIHLEQHICVLKTNFITNKCQQSVLFHYIASYNPILLNMTPKEQFVCIMKKFLMTIDICLKISKGKFKVGGWGPVC